MSDKADCMADLKARYPYQFQGEAIGLELPPGWLPIFSRLCEDIDATLTKEEKQTFYWVQLKEKFGTARFYCEMGEAKDSLRPEIRGAVLSFRPIAANEKIRDLIAEAEAATGDICQKCGEPGTLRRGTWWRTVCDRHEAEYQARIKDMLDDN